MPEITDPISKIVSVYQSYQRSLDEAIAERVALEERITHLALRVEVSKEMCAAVQNGSNGSHVGNDTPVFPVMGKYAGLTTTPAILAVLASIPGKSWAPSDLARYLMDNGFQSASKNLPVLLRNICVRLSEKNRIKKVRRHGRVEFEAILHEEETGTA